MKKSCAEVSVTEADVSLLCNRARYTERLKSLADNRRSFRSGFNARFNSESNTESVSPNSVIKSNRLNALDDRLNIYAL